MRGNVWLLLVALSLPVLAAAQSLVGTTVSPSQAAPIRQEPPQGYLKLPGREVATTEVGVPYVIRRETTLPYLFSDQIWVLVGRNDDAAPLGWVYWGATTDLQSSENFEVIKSNNTTGGSMIQG